MTAAILLVLSSACVGILVVRALAPRSSPGLVLSCGILIGSTIPGLILFLLSLIHVPWSLLLMAIGTLMVGVVAMGKLHLRSALSALRSPSWVLLVDGLTLMIVLGYAVFATIAPPAEADFVTDWGLKGRVFFHARGLDFEFLDSPANAFAHPDYPVLLPLVFDSVALVAGQWDPEGFGLLYAVWGGATLLLIRTLLSHESGSSWFAAISTLVVAPLALSPFLGLGEGPVLAYGTAGVLMLRRALRNDDGESMLLGAILLGLASQFKNEGLTLLIAALVAALLIRGRPLQTLRDFFPALVIAIPWLIVRAFHALPTDLAQGQVLERVWLHLKQSGQIYEAMARYPLGKPLFWLGIALAAALTLRRALIEEKFAFTTLAIQFLFFMAAYLASPHTIDWHFKWSWERVIGQITLLIAVVILAQLAPFFGTYRMGNRKVE